jgi:hypothetical protein
MSWRGLILFTSIVSLFSLAYSVSRVEASPLALALFRLAPPLGAALWVEADARNFRPSALLRVRCICSVWLACRRALVLFLESWTAGLARGPGIDRPDPCPIPDRRHLH